MKNTVIITLMVICLTSLLTLLGLAIIYIWMDWNDLLSKLLKTSILILITSFIGIGILSDSDSDDNYDIY